MCHFHAQFHTWKACRQAPRCLEDPYCVKSVRGMTIQGIEVLLSAGLSSVLYGLKTAFLYPHSNMKFIMNLYIHYLFYISGTLF